MQETAISLNSGNAYFEVKPDSITAPHVEVALTVLVSQFPGIVRGMVRQVSTREYAVRLFVEHAEVLQEVWIPVRDVPYETNEARFGQCIGNPPVQWAALVERALHSAQCDADLPGVLRALTGRAEFESVSNTAPMQTIWSTILGANTRALVICKMQEGDMYFGVLGAYTDKDGSRRVVLQQGQETIDVSLARYLVDHACTHIVRPVQAR